MSHAFKTNERKTFTRQKRAEIYMEREGLCGKKNEDQSMEFGCGRKIFAGEPYIIEHAIALENGGTNDVENLYLTCQNCKSIKDKKDHGLAAKTRHQATKHFTSRSDDKKKWNVIPGSKASKWKKKLNGEVIRRD